MIRGTTDVVIRVEQRLGQQRAHVSTTKTVDNPPTVTTADNQAGESQLGQVLACNGGAAISDLCQTRTKNAVMDLHAARMLGVSVALGLPGDLEALCAQPDVAQAGYQRARAIQSTELKPQPL